MTIALAMPDIPASPVQLVRYRSYGSHEYAACIAGLHEDGTCDLLAVAHCSCCPQTHGREQSRTTMLHRATYDGSGQARHSWRK